MWPGNKSLSKGDNTVDWDIKENFLNRIIFPHILGLQQTNQALSWDTCLTASVGKFLETDE